MIKACFSSLVMNAGMMTIKDSCSASSIVSGMGVFIAIFQAVTQIHEQTLGFILKLIVVILVLLIGGGWMMETLLDYTRGLFELMAGR